MNKKLLFLMLLLSSFSTEALAATCTSIRTGLWDVSSTWSCGRTPSSSDTVIISSGHIVTLDKDRTINNITIDGTLDSAGNDLNIDGAGVINGSFLCSGNCEIRLDNNNATLTIGSAGIIDGTGQNNGNRILNLNDTSTSVVNNGTILAPNSYIDFDKTGSNFTNNGTVSVSYLNNNSTSQSWTQGDYSTLTLLNQGAWTGAFDASATGNTVVFDGTSTPISPATYYNVSGPGVTCPVPAGITILGPSPCVPSAPTATTNAATALTATGATLNGTVSSNNASTTVTFEYGLTTGYGSTVTAAESPVATNGVAVTAAVTGLSCNTLYHYRVKAVNSVATAYGSDMTFTTGACNLTSGPTSCVSDATVGTYAWTGLGNVATSDNLYAQADGFNGSITNYLKCTGYNFNLPSNAVITGITLGVERYSTRTFSDAFVHLVKGG